MTDHRIGLTVPSAQWDFDDTVGAVYDTYGGGINWALATGYFDANSAAVLMGFGKFTHVSDVYETYRAYEDNGWMGVGVRGVSFTAGLVTGLTVSAGVSAVATPAAGAVPGTILRSDETPSRGYDRIVRAI